MIPRDLLASAADSIRAKTDVMPPVPEGPDFEKLYKIAEHYLLWREINTNRADLDSESAQASAVGDINHFLNYCFFARRQNDPNLTGPGSARFWVEECKFGDWIRWQQHPHPTTSGCVNSVVAALTNVLPDEMVKEIEHALNEGGAWSSGGSEYAVRIVRE